MKILQIVYPGLGGNGAVAFSLVEGQNKNKKFKNFFLFYGIERIINGYKRKSLALNVKFFYLKKKRYQTNLLRILGILNKVKPHVIIVHDYNLFPYFIYKILRKKKIIYVHHTPDKTKKIFDWIIYIFNSILSEKIVLVSKRRKSDFMNKLNKFFFKKKVVVIVNGINVDKFKNEKNN